MTATRIRRVLSIQPVAECGGSDHALLRMVRQLGSRGWDCHVALPESSPMADEFAAAGATLHVVPMRRLTTSGGLAYRLGYLLGWPVSVVRLVRLVRRLDVDIVHSNSLHSWYGWAVAGLTARPHVWHAREIVVQSSAALRVERLLVRHFADRVIAVSAAVAAQLDDVVAERDLVIVLDEPSPEDFRPDLAGAFRRRVGIADDIPLLATVGRIDVWKGIDVVLDALPLIRESCPGAELVVAGATVAGKEEYAATLARRAERLLGARWLGLRSDVPELLADSDVVVMASTEPEPFGLVMVEALASGVPVVATAAGGPLEVLADADPAAGRLVQPHDVAGLARAVGELLPAGGSSTEARRARRPLRAASGADFDAVLGAALESGRRRRTGRGRTGRGRTGLRRTGLRIGRRPARSVR